MCAYYRRFIEKFSLIAGPLHDLTKKNVKYVWTEGKQEASDKLKQKLTSQPVLVLPDLSKPFEVQCDACGDSLGAVLLQEGHAIAYESRRLSSDEQILGIYEKELLAVLHALDSWKHYLLGTPFILRTDHQSLKYFMTQTKLSDKQMRWANFLSRFNFHIAHIAGKHNQVADALSRRPKVNAVSIATHNDLSSMIDEYAIDPDFKDVISAIALGKKEEPFTLEDGYLLHGNRLFTSTILCIKDEYLDERDIDLNASQRGIGGYPIIPEYGAKNNYMHALPASLKGDLFFGQTITRDVEGVDLLRALGFQFKYARKLCECLEKGFIDNSSMHSIRILVPAQDPMHERLLKDYGNEKCEKIASFYGVGKMIGNVLFAPIVDAESFKVEFRKFKRHAGIEFSKMSLVEVSSLLANNVTWKDIVIYSDTTQYRQQHLSL
ncbi:hypothetical protein L7F22_041338 [Adiantum nelumboides]|nr:hypothetical protein [Adiantum nelumboides]